MIFFIDTAFDITTLAIKKDGNIYKETIEEKINISQALIDRTKNLFNKAGANKKDIKLISFNQGPGNFTSLRVSLSYIKAVAYYLNIPIVKLNSFQILAMSSFEKNNINPVIVAIDARMNEIYWVVYKNYLQIYSKINNYNITSEKIYYEKLSELNIKEHTIIKNNLNILQNHKKRYPSSKEYIIESIKIDLPNIFDAIEKMSIDGVSSIDEVNLLYIRDNVAKKKYE